MDWQDDVSPSLAAEGSTIIEQDAEGVSENVPSIMIEFADLSP